MDAKKEIVLAAIKNVAHLQNLHEAENFAQHNQTVYNTAFETAKVFETYSNRKAVVAFNTFLSYLYERRSINLEELEDRDEWVEHFKKEIVL